MKKRWYFLALMAGLMATGCGNGKAENEEAKTAAPAENGLAKQISSTLDRAAEQYKYKIGRAHV